MKKSLKLALLLFLVFPNAAWAATDDVSSFAKPTTNDTFLQTETKNLPQAFTISNEDEMHFPKEGFFTLIDEEGVLLEDTLLFEKMDQSEVVLDVLLKGEKVSVLEESSEDWYTVSYNNKVGYITYRLADFLKNDTSKSLETQLSTLKNEKLQKIEEEKKQAEEAKKQAELEAKKQAEEQAKKKEEEKNLEEQKKQKAAEVSLQKKSVKKEPAAEVKMASVTKKVEEPVQLMRAAIAPIEEKEEVKEEVKESNNDSDLASDIIATSKKYLGTPYLYGAKAGSTSSFDCSSFTQYVYGKYGISLPRSSASQATVGSTVSKGSLQKGDLVFFTTYKEGVSHVGIYIGGGNMISATNDGVSIDSINSSYWSKRYVTSKRVL